MEYVAATLAFIAVAAIGHALDVRARNKELFAHCVALANVLALRMQERDALMHEAKMGRAA